MPRDQLAQANALDQLVRPIALRMIGPALGGVLVGAFGASAVFALDAVSFAGSAVALLLMRPPAVTRATASAGSVVGDLREGWRFVRERRWLWVTFVSAAVAYLLFMGPVEVLVPYVVKHDLGGTASDLGLIFGAGGLASILTAMVVGQLGLPRRSMTFMYLAWTVATIAVAGYGLGTAVWHLMIASAVFNALETAGTIVWITAKQQHVPAGMLGRVSSLDWLISIGLLPLSFALTGPVSELVGAQTTLVVAGLAGAAVTFGGLLVPGVRAIERRSSREAVRTAQRVRGMTRDMGSHRQDSPTTALERESHDMRGLRSMRRRGLQNLHPVIPGPGPQPGHPGVISVRIAPDRPWRLGISDVNGSGRSATERCARMRPIDRRAAASRGSGRSVSLVGRSLGTTSRTAGRDLRSSTQASRPVAGRLAGDA